MNRLQQSTLNLDSIDSIESTITNGLRVAAERYQTLAKEMRDDKEMDVKTRESLANQFDIQQKEVLRIAEQISESGLISLWAETSHGSFYRAAAFTAKLTAAVRTAMRLGEVGMRNDHEETRLAVYVQAAATLMGPQDFTQDQYKE